MKVVPSKTLKDKRLKKIMGEDYHLEPALREILSRFEGVQRVEDMDNGRPVEWENLESERERKIAMVHFWKGVDRARQWREDGVL